MHAQNHSIKNIALLALGALGVVYGDIGTSPLYAINEIFFGHALSHFTHLDVLGAISMVVWALTLVVAFKYIIFVLRADSEGEGGVFALYNLLTSLPKSGVIVPGLLLFAAGLLYGDGIITPAISVISAVEGIRILTPTLTPFVIPITIIILTAIFAFQYKGTHKIGNVFGPIMLVWFCTLGILGLGSILNHPGILAALNPVYAYNFLTTHSLHTVLLTLGSVMLVITGGEAMYADMGHFGRLPIRLGWFLIAYPSLLLNYLGQGAFLLSGQEVLAHNIFYSMVPPSLLLPMVILATSATIIASQALISGAFSLTMQAISLRLLPYLRVVHTHLEHEGQIYIARINWALYLGSVILVLAFGSSSRLAGAYGLAVSGVMAATTIAMVFVAIKLWQWSRFKSLALFIPFLALDLVFVISNSLKFFDGGYVPFTIGLVIFAMIKLWVWGRQHTTKTFSDYSTHTVKWLVKKISGDSHVLPRTMIFLTRYTIKSKNDRLPIQLERFLDRIGLIPGHLVLLNVEFVKRPHVSDRFDIKTFYQDDEKKRSITSIIVRFGFMESPDLEPLIDAFIAHKDIPSCDPPSQWSFKILHERVFGGPDLNFFQRIKFFFYAGMQKNAASADEYLGLGQTRGLTVDVFPVMFK
jgi:KUP system potassium uptake protein